MAIRYSVMKGYWGSEKQTKESIVDGWMKTGDVGIIDERGFCKVVGRHKVGTQSLLPDSQDMVIRGGENIYPREIEDFLFAHPNIVDIQVVGVYDEKVFPSCASSDLATVRRRVVRLRHS